MWEMDDPVKEERREIPYPTNLAQLYTLQSRHILLNRCGDKIMGYIAIRGDSFTGSSISHIGCSSHSILSLLISTKLSIIVSKKLLPFK